MRKNLPLLAFAAMIASSAPALADYNLSLTPGVVDTGHYGKFFGQDHDSVTTATNGALAVSFTTTSAGPVMLRFTAFDIDLDDEVSVAVNGVHHSNLPRGGNNVHSVPQTVELGVLNAGSHVVHFVNRRSGWVWGVSDLLLTTNSPEDNTEPAPTIQELLANLNCGPEQLIQVSAYNESGTTGGYQCIEIPDEQCDPEFAYYWSEANSPFENPLHWESATTMDDEGDLGDLGCVVLKPFGAEGILRFHVQDQQTDYASISVSYRENLASPQISLFHKEVSSYREPFSPQIPLSACATMVGCDDYFAAD